MKKLLPILLALGLCGAALIAQTTDKNKTIKKDDAPAEGNKAQKGGGPADQGAKKKDDAPAESRKNAKDAKVPEKQTKAADKQAK